MERSDPSPVLAAAGSRGAAAVVARPLPKDRRSPLLARLPADPTERRTIVRAHQQALDAGSPTYLDPRTGLVVLTAGYLWRVGRCCRSGCRHCPFAAGVRHPEVTDA
ncbi:MAG: DUF5522 domain-containing protein [Nitriliruptoraceae bacterium]